MDGLQDPERIEAWRSAWTVSLTGMALLTADFQFHRVNEQWIHVLGAPASEFYGRTFLDITPPDIRHADEEQAKLVIEGKINSYIMHKRYSFSNGDSRAATLLVTRIPMDCEKPFQFFLSRVMLDGPTAQAPLKQSILNPESEKSILVFFLKHAKWFAAAGAAAAGAVAALADRYG